MGAHDGEKTGGERGGRGFLAAVLFTVLLVAGAVWLVAVISDQRKLDRCLSSGRKNCVEFPQGQRSPGQPAF